MALITPEFYAVNDPFVKKNYGKIKIDAKGVELLMNDYYGNTAQRVYLSYEDMAFDEDLLKYDRFCLAKSSK